MNADASVQWYRKTIILIGLVALAYYLFARLGFFVAIPPGNVSPIWPPAGIAFLSVFFLGMKVFPGIWLGSFLANLWFYLSVAEKSLFDMSPLPSLLISVGPVLQAWGCLYLYRHWGPSDGRIKTSKELLTFSFLIAPISCLIASLWGNSVLFIAGDVPVQNLPLTFLTWWWGDTAGVVIFAPLALIGNIKKASQNEVQSSPMLGTIITLVVVLFLALVGSWKAATHIQDSSKVTVGISLWDDKNLEYSKNVSAFKAALDKEGFVEGKTIEYIIQTPHAKKDAVPAIIEMFIQKKVSLIFTQTTPATLVAKKMAENIPVVFSIVTYPVETGVIETLESSNGNIVGTRNYIPMQRQFSIFKKLAPQVNKVAFVHRKGEPNSTYQLREFESFSKKEGIQVFELAVTSKDEIYPLLMSLRGKIDSIYSACDTLIQTGGEEEVIRFAQTFDLPDFACLASGVQKGSLIGNVADYVSIGSEAGKQAAMILRGEKPQKLKTVSVDHDTILVNMRRAEQLGVFVSPEVLNLANEIVR